MLRDDDNGDSNEGRAGDEDVGAAADGQAAVVGGGSGQSITAPGDGSVVTIDPAELEIKAEKLLHREDLQCLTKEQALAALVEHGAHVGRAAISLRKNKLL